MITLATSIGLQQDFAEADATGFASGTLRVPGKEVLRESHFRINLLDLLFQREMHQTFNFARYGSADSSRQGRHNYFAMLEDRFGWKKSLDARSRLNVDLQNQF